MISSSKNHPTAHVVQCRARIVSNERIAKETYRLRCVAPEIARSILPGQFVMARIPSLSDPLIGRPFALYDTHHDKSGNPWALEIVYLVAGKMTTCLARLDAGDSIDLWGPLGRGFIIRSVKHLIMVAGGIGQTPFLSLAQSYLGRRASEAEFDSGGMWPRITLCYGARSADRLAGLEDFAQLGIELRIATDDGSAGLHGPVTMQLADVLKLGTAGVHVACCGPEPMMSAVAQICAAASVSCEVSLETPMACGIGICFSCVARIRDEQGNWDYRRTCVEGPVFDSASVVW